ncbi:adenylate/guanylate cyclase [Candidatus Vecturithrix granuli]|uniref:Adenylate cyclase n=1 Tax=Vecturithrix granuli TaxID=1499967 RepID=A0A081BUV1_VECG1|nr:adenylate/guanylate cyclase [Candidatus Vecturithrix granuli]
MYVSGVAVHIAAIFIFLRFVYALVVIPIMWIGFGCILLLFTEIPHVYVLWQFLFLAALSFFCVLNIYLRERSMRENFYQKHVIEEREKELAKQQEKSERLLLNILPKPIAERLKEHHHIIADVFDETTILFADIVGFTQLCKQIPAEELVTILNTLFSLFDALTDKFGLEKIKTIGDVYMAAAGLPEHQADHADMIAKMALEMCQTMTTYNTTASHPLQLRIGIHSGSVIAGVIGRKKFTYDLCGDTVNTASRVGSHGIPGQIQVTQTAYELLKHKFTFSERGVIDVKGKGAIRVYLLDGSRES